MITETMIRKWEENMLAQGKQISDWADHKNWYPCGRAYVVIRGTEPLVRLIKKLDQSPLENQGSSYYTFGRFSIFKGSYGGYELAFRYPAKDAYESQSLNFEEPLAQYLSELLTKEGIKNHVRTWID